MRISKNEVRAKLIKTALGQIEADLVIKNAQILNVFTDEIISGDVAVQSGWVAGVGVYTKAKKTIDAGGMYLVPGFINAHCHVESSISSPKYYSAAELRHGVTTIIADPHELANVAGAEGIRYLLNSLKDMQIDCYVQAASCVPATAYETSGAVLDADALAKLLQEPGVIGLGEMMNYKGILDCDSDILDKLSAAQGHIIDGHAPGLMGRELSGYAAAGIHTDHESVLFDEALEKIRAGIAVLIREGSTAKNLSEIVSGLVKHNIKTELIAFCSDDKHWAEIYREGTVRSNIQKAIALGLKPETAYAMGTLNAARIYRLWDIGAIAPGYRADMVLISDFEKATVEQVFKDGIAQDKEHMPPEQKQKTLKNTVNLPPIDVSTFALPTCLNGEYPVIKTVAGQIITQKGSIKPQDVSHAIESGKLCKLAVIERHKKTGNVGVALLEGYGIRNGAVASTMAHDSHNLIIAGDNDADMVKAAEEIKRIHGGFLLVQGGEVRASLPLPIYGLMTESPPSEFLTAHEKLLGLLYEAGVSHDIDPLLTLSFLALPVIPEIRLTDKGVFDVLSSKFID